MVEIAGTLGTDALNGHALNIPIHGNEGDEDYKLRGYDETVCPFFKRYNPETMGHPLAE